MTRPTLTVAFDVHCSFDCCAKFSLCLRRVVGWVLLFNESALNPGMKWDLGEKWGRDDVASAYVWGSLGLMNVKVSLSFGCSLASLIFTIFSVG